MLAIHVEKMVETEGLSGLPWEQVESNEQTSGPAQTYDLTATLSFNSKDLRVGRRKKGMETLVAPGRRHHFQVVHRSRRKIFALGIKVTFSSRGKIGREQRV